MRFTIKTKLIAGFGSVLVLAGAAGGIGYFRLSQTRDAMNEGTKLSRNAQLVQEIHANLNRSGSLVRAMVIETDDAKTRISIGRSWTARPRTTPLSRR